MESFEKIKSSAGTDIIYNKLVYAESSQEINEIAKILPKYVELIMLSDSLDDTKGHEYRCAVILDKANKKIVFASSGTRFELTNKGVEDIKADISLIKKNMPSKFQSISNLNNIIIDNLGSDLKDYKFHYTGHSLGGAMASLASADMLLKLDNQDVGIKDKITCLTFENPGCKHIMRDFYKKNNKNLDFYTDHIDSKIFNNSKNLVNQLNEQVGETYQILQDEKKNKFGSFYAMLSGISKILKHLKFPEYLIKICNILSYGRLKKQIDSHRLARFDEVILKDQGYVITPDGKKIDMNDIFNNKNELPYHENIFKEVTKMQSINGKIGNQIYSMNSSKDEKSISISKVELNSAINKCKSKSNSKDDKIFEAIKNATKTSSMSR